jgi:hypothetical protein
VAVTVDSKIRRPQHLRVAVLLVHSLEKLRPIVP